MPPTLMTTGWSAAATTGSEARDLPAQEDGLEVSSSSFVLVGPLWWRALLALPTWKSGRRGRRNGATSATLGHQGLQDREPLLHALLEGVYLRGDGIQNLGIRIQS